MSGEWDEQQKIGCCIEDPSQQQRPEMDNRKRRRSRSGMNDGGSSTYSQYVATFVDIVIRGCHWSKSGCTLI